MKVAFYAPLKPPDWPVPSGDRTIARSIIRALTIAGHTVTVAARLRAFNRTGVPERSAQIAQRANRITDGLIRRYGGSSAAGTDQAWAQPPDICG